MLRRGSFSFSRNFFFFSIPTLYQIGEASKKKISSRVCMYARINESIYIYFFLFFFYFFFIKRKVSEGIPFNSELWVRNSNNFRKNVLIFRRNGNNFGRNKDKWVRNFDRKTVKNAPKSALFQTPKITVFSLVAQ